MFIRRVSRFRVPLRVLVTIFMFIILVGCATYYVVGVFPSYPSKIVLKKPVITGKLVNSTNGLEGYPVVYVSLKDFKNLSRGKTVFVYTTKVAGFWKTYHIAELFFLENKSAVVAKVSIEKLFASNKTYRMYSFSFYRNKEIFQIEGNKLFAVVVFSFTEFWVTVLLFTTILLYILNFAIYMKYYFNKNKNIVFMFMFFVILSLIVVITEVKFLFFITIDASIIMFFIFIFSVVIDSRMRKK